MVPNIGNKLIQYVNILLVPVSNTEPLLQIPMCGCLLLLREFLCSSKYVFVVSTLAV